ncbi:MAG: hypothetical protein CFH10_00288 [Alphaproteobacteria bacterium MarineAlpha4_Bin2]|nr:MAG: hypothetical protein CFH10_00288 [Alphaproteobacteria bacterium MarineAlpha4_Bin2]
MTSLLKRKADGDGTCVAITMLEAWTKEMCIQMLGYAERSYGGVANEEILIAMRSDGSAREIGG